MALLFIAIDPNTNGLNCPAVFIEEETGDFLGDELTDDPAIARACAGAFEAVWERAVPHDEYRPA
jgi:hypothetical protein